MTGRERLSRRKRGVAAGLLGAAALFGLGLVALQATGEVLALALVVPGFLVLVGTAFWGQWFALRCPWCRGNLGIMLVHMGWWRLDPRVRYCPYCGTGFDAEMPGGGGVDDATAARWDEPVE